MQVNSPETPLGLAVTREDRANLRSRGPVTGPWGTVGEREHGVDRCLGPVVGVRPEVAVVSNGASPPPDEAVLVVPHELVLTRTRGVVRVMTYQNRGGFW